MEPQSLETFPDAEPSGKDDSRLCRICFSGEQIERLVQPCNCKGSIGFVHLSCLSRWQMLENTSNRCNMCLATYDQLFQLPWSKRFMKQFLWTMKFIFFTLLVTALFAGTTCIFFLLPVSSCVYFTSVAYHEYIRTQEVISCTNVIAVIANICSCYLLYGFYCIVNFVVLYYRIVYGYV